MHVVCQPGMWVVVVTGWLPGMEHDGRRGGGRARCLLPTALPSTPHPHLHLTLPSSPLDPGLPALAPCPSSGLNRMLAVAPPALGQPPASCTHHHKSQAPHSRGRGQGQETGGCVDAPSMFRATGVTCGRLAGKVLYCAEV